MHPLLKQKYFLNYLRFKIPKLPSQKPQIPSLHKVSHSKYVERKKQLNHRLRVQLRLEVKSRVVTKQKKCYITQ